MSDEENTPQGTAPGDSFQHASTYDAMQAILREIGVIAKSRTTDSRNENFKFAFRGIEELLEVVNPLCKKHGLLTPPVMVGDPIVSEYQTKNATMHWVMVPTAIHFQATADNDDVIVGGPFLGEAGDAGDKAATKAQSVAWREIMFKTFNVPTRGDDYDTEQGDQEDKAAISSAEKEAKAAADRLEMVRMLGWDDHKEQDDAWGELKQAATGEAESAVWLREWMTSRSMTKKKFEATLYTDLTAILANAKQDGNWKANFTPPADD